MTDLISSDWKELDADNSSPSPNGVQGGYSPSQVAPVIRAIRGSLKRFYNQSNAIYTSTGTATAYVLTFQAAPSGYSKGIVYRFWAHVSNTGAATLNINSLGAKPIVSSVDGSPLISDQIVSGKMVEVIYNGSSFELLSDTKQNSKLSGNTVLTGSITVSGGLVQTGNSVQTGNATVVGLQTIVNTGESLRISSGDATSDPHISFFKTINSTETRQGYLQHRVGTTVGLSGLALHNDVANTRLLLDNTPGTNGLTFRVGSTNYNVWNTGNLPNPANTTTQIIAGNGLTGGGSISTNRTLTLGTPSTITGNTTNSVSGNTHTHQLILTADDILNALGYTPGKGDGVPIGGMIMVYGNDSQAPDGYLLANGAAVTSTYPELRAFGLARGWQVNGQGNPILPDMGGYFARGWRSGQTIDSGRVFGSIQQDQFQNHRHPANRVTNATISVPVNNNQYGPTPYIVDGYTNVSWGSANGHGADLADPTSNSGTPRTGAETRPINVTVTYWIKAFSAGQTTGTADLTQLANNVTTLQSKVDTLGIKRQATIAPAGNAFTITGIPAGVQRVRLKLNALAIATAGQVGIRLGTSTGIETGAGAYASSVAGFALTNLQSNQYNNFFALQDSSIGTGATIANYGYIELQRQSQGLPNSWNMQCMLTRGSGPNFSVGGCTISGELTQIQFITVAGNVAFKAGGSVDIEWEF